MAEPDILRRRVPRRLSGCLGHLLALPLAAFVCAAVVFAPALLVLRDALGVEGELARRLAGAALLVAFAVAAGLLLRDGVRYVTASLSLAPGRIEHVSGPRRDAVDLSLLAEIEAGVPLVDGPLSRLRVRSSDGGAVELGDDWPLASVLAHLAALGLPGVEAALDRLAREHAVLLERVLAAGEGGAVSVLARQVFAAAAIASEDASDDARVRRLFPYLVRPPEAGGVVVLAARREDAVRAVIPSGGAALVSCLLPRHRVLRLEDGRWGAAILPRALAPIGKLCEHGEEHAP